MLFSLVKFSVHGLSFEYFELDQFAFVASHDIRAPLVNLSQLVKYFDQGKFRSGVVRERT